MPKRPTHKITKRMVDALSSNGKSGAFWDRDLPGFGVRVYRSGRTTYVVQVRGPYGSRRVTLGRHGELSAEQARKRAAVVIERIKAGEEPFEAVPEPVPEPTVADLAERCLRTYVEVRCKPLTARGYRQQLRNHILPALGEMPVASVGQEYIEALHHSLRDRPAAANATLGVLSRMFSLAEAWGWRPKGSHPCKSVRKYKAHYRERFLSREEYRRIGRVLREADAKGSPWPASVAAIRLIMLTGCRCEEIGAEASDDFCAIQTKHGRSPEVLVNDNGLTNRNGLSRPRPDSPSPSPPSLSSTEPTGSGVIQDLADRLTGKPQFSQQRFGVERRRLGVVEGSRRIGDGVGGRIGIEVKRYGQKR